MRAAPLAALAMAFAPLGAGAATPSLPRTSAASINSGCAVFVGSTCVVPDPGSITQTANSECSTLYLRLGRSSPNCTNGAQVPIFVETPDGPVAVNSRVSAFEATMAAGASAIGGISGQVGPLGTCAVAVGSGCAVTNPGGVAGTLAGAAVRANPLQPVFPVHLDVTTENTSGGYSGCPQTGKSCSSNMYIFTEIHDTYTCCDANQNAYGWWHGDWWMDDSGNYYDSGDGYYYDFLTSYANITSQGDGICGLSMKTAPNRNFPKDYESDFFPAGTQYFNNGQSSYGASYSYGGASVSFTDNAATQGYIEGDSNPQDLSLTGTWSVGQSPSDASNCTQKTANLGTGIVYQTPRNANLSGAAFDWTGFIYSDDDESACC